MNIDWMHKSHFMDSAAPDLITGDGEPIYCDETGRMKTNLTVSASSMGINLSKPDGYTPKGVPVFIMSRGCGKSMSQLEMYRILCGISNDEWARIRQETMKEMYGDDWDVEEEDDD